MPCRFFKLELAPAAISRFKTCQMPLIRRAHQSRPSQLVLRIHLSVLGDKEFDHLHPAFLCGLHQGGLADEISGINVDASCKQRLNCVCLPLSCC